MPFIVAELAPRRPFHVASVRRPGRKGTALISARTKAALAAKKEAGAKLGNPRAAESVGKARAAHKAAADQFAANVLPIVREIQEAGRPSLREIAATLDARVCARRAAVNGAHRRSATAHAAGEVIVAALMVQRQARSDDW